MRDHEIHAETLMAVPQEVDDPLDYRSRLSVEVGDLTLATKTTQEGTSTSLQVFRVEAVEHLPSQTRYNEHDAALLAEVNYSVIFLGPSNAIPSSHLNSRVS